MLVTNGAGGYTARFGHLFFMVSAAKEADGRRWGHGSVSRGDRKLPTYEDLQTLKRFVFGPHRKAIQVFPANAEHEDFAGKLMRLVQVLHLWSCEDGDVLPDFRTNVLTEQGEGRIA